MGRLKETVADTTKIVSKTDSIIRISLNKIAEYKYKVNILHQVYCVKFCVKYILLLLAIELLNKFLYILYCHKY